MRLTREKRDGETYRKKDRDRHFEGTDRQYQTLMYSRVLKVKDSRIDSESEST